MGEYYYLACKRCKEMVFLGKPTEPLTKKVAKVTHAFMNEHLLHPLVVTGDEYNVDEEVFGEATTYRRWEPLDGEGDAE